MLAKTAQLDQWAAEREKNIQDRSDRPDHNVVAHDNLSNQIIGIPSHEYIRIYFINKECSLNIMITHTIIST